MRNGELHERLGDPKLYERQIDRLHRRYVLTRHLYELQEENVSLATIFLRRSRLARIIARTVARGEYESGPARIRWVQGKTKVRKVFAYRLTDVIVHGAVAEVLAEAVAPTLSPGLYSYQPGLSWWFAVSDFAAYLRLHWKRCPDPRRRHMYVLRRDIAAYTDSIPVDDASPIWPMVRGFLYPPGSAPPRPADWDLVRRAVRPELEAPSGARTPLDRGVATGQPIASVLYNLYLQELDRRLGPLPGAFYARYSDDLLFAHPSPEQVRNAGAAIEDVVAGLCLGLRDTKSRDLYLTGAGRASSEWTEAAGTTAVPFMGANVRADGTVALSRGKARNLLRDLEGRARRTAGALDAGSPEEVGRLVCAAINQALDPDGPEFLEQKSAALVRRAVTDRRQLAELDYRIARIVLLAVTGDPSVKAFRRITYRRMREAWGLVSLEHARNRWGKRAG